MDRKAALTKYIKSEIMHNSNARLDENEDLLSAGILDSLGILQLVVFINSTFGIEVPDGEVVYENFHSVNAMVDYLQQYS
jgi:acyl carrier protein